MFHYDHTCRFFMTFYLHRMNHAPVPLGLKSHPLSIYDKLFVLENEFKYDLLITALRPVFKIQFIKRLNLERQIIPHGTSKTKKLGLSIFR